MNGNKPIKQSIKDKIYKYFDYKWTHDRLMALDDDDEVAILE